jgi:HK97 family phage prohead protease
MRLTDFTVQVKAGPDDQLEEGLFTAYASVFDVKDSYGDVVVKGAFTDTLTEWAERDAKIPLLFAHNMSDPDYNIGFIEEAVEDDTGLLVRGRLDLENPKAEQVYRLLKSRRIDQMSFAFDVTSDRVVGSGNEKTRELLGVKLYEVSVVTLGANQETQILDVKTHQSADVKAGRVLAQKHIDSLRDAVAAIQRVIEAADTGEPDDGKTSLEMTAKAEDPKRGNADEQINAQVIEKARKAIAAALR